MDIKEIKSHYEGLQIREDIRNNVVRGINNLQTAMERMNLGVGYDVNDLHFSHLEDTPREEVYERRACATDVMLHHPWAIKPRGAIHHYATSKGARYHSDNKDLDRIIRLTTKNPMSDAFDLGKNIDHELGDGAVAYQLVHVGGEIVTIRSMDINAFEIGSGYRSRINPNQVWLHRTYQNTTEGEVYTYFPDVLFFPDDKLRNSLAREISESHESQGSQAVFQWEQKVYIKIWNHGVPLMYPISLYLQCLDAVIGLQSAVLQSIAHLATYAQISDEDERYQAMQKLQEMSMKEGDINSKVSAINQEFGSNTIVTSGKISSVNLTIAMLQKTSALYELITHSVYNAVPGLESTDWSEIRRYSLGDQGSQQNSIQVSSGLMRQRDHGQMYIDLLEGVLVILGHKGIFVPGTELLTVPVNINGSGIATYVQVDYERDQHVQVTWPEIIARNMKDTVESVVMALTLDGRIGRPLGLPSDAVKMFEGMGMCITLQSDDWEDYKLGETLVMQRTNEGSRDANPAQAQEALKELLLNAIQESN